MIRFGIVGFGLHAVKRLMPGFARAERCEVTALSRPDPARAGASAREFAIPEYYTATADLCASPNVDAVLVTSPDALHLPDVLTAIEAGKPVLCEKPLAMNGGQAHRMVAAARAVDLFLGVAQVFRFEESTRWFRESIAAGAIGRPLTARAEFFYPGLESPRKWITDPALACGGPIADVGVHCFDALRFVLADEIIAVATRAMADEHSGPFEANALLSFSFESGTLASVAVSTRAPYRTFLEVIGDEGSIAALDALNVERPITIERRAPAGGGVVERVEVTNSEAYARQVDAFAATLEEGTPFPVPGEEGLQNQLILDAAYRSFVNGRIESVG